MTVLKGVRKVEREYSARKAGPNKRRSTRIWTGFPLGYCSGFASTEWIDN